MSAKKPIPALVDEHLRALAESDLHPTVQRKSGEALAKRVEEFRQRGANQDRRGHLLAAAGKRVRKVVAGLTRAVRHAEGHEDPEVRHKAKELVRSVQHVPFEDIEARLSKFVGRLNKAGHARKERRKLSARKSYVIGTPEDDLQVVELNSSDQLESTGRALDLCVAHKRNHSWYFRALRDGTSRFHRFESRSSGEPVALMETDHDNQVSCLEAAGGDGYEIPSQRAGLDIVRKLGVMADSEVAFSSVGAFACFAEGRPRPQFVPVDDHEWGVWCFPGRRQMVLVRVVRGSDGKRRPVRRSWSLFEIETTRVRRRRPGRPGRSTGARAEWVAVSRHEGALNEAHLLDLVLRSPDLYEALRSAGGFEADGAA